MAPFRGSLGSLIFEALRPPEKNDISSLKFAGIFTDCWIA